MLCGASTIQYYPKSNQKTSNLLLLKTVGFKPCKMKSMNLIDWTSVHMSSGLTLQRQMKSADNTSGPIP
ncbi:hypothetical protein Tco_0921811 [Tanacetum coccineum]